jgi:RNA polymerase sigma factor (sigma-70 family)
LAASAAGAWPYLRAHPIFHPPSRIARPGMDQQDARLAPGQGAFPLTRHSVVLATRSEDPEVWSRAYDTLVAAYWKPVYKYVRLKWHLSREDAEDLTQGFFTQALTRDFFARYDPARARFRTFLRTCLHAFAANEQKAAQRLKRGGGTQLVSLDFEGAERELAQSRGWEKAEVEDYFRQEWIRSLFGLAVEALRERLEGSARQTHFQLFERYDLCGADAPDRPTYGDLAKTFDLPATQVTNYLAGARREFRRIVLERLRELTGSEEEFRLEARELLGIDPP